MAAGLYDIVAALQAIGAELKSTAEEATKASTAVERAKAKAGRGEAATGSVSPAGDGSADSKKRSSSTGDRVTVSGLTAALKITRGRGGRS